jgi:hypothetical protein
MSIESLESRQLLSATPQLQVLNDATTNIAYKYAVDGTSQGSHALVAANAAPRGAASSAALEKSWIVDANRNVYVYSTSGALLGSWSAGTLANNATVEGIATNGTDIWIVDSKSDKIFHYAGGASRLSGNQTATSSFSLASGNTTPKDMVTDGAHLWVVDDAKQSDKVFKYTVAGSLVGSWTIGTANKAPTGITLDPNQIGDIWIADSGTDRVYKYTAATALNGGSLSPTSSFALASGNTNPHGLVIPGRAWTEAAPEIEWVQQLGSSGDEIGRGISADGTGNIYLSGHSSGSLGASNPTGVETAYLTKYDASGNPQWLHQSEPNTPGHGTRVAADNLGNVFRMVGATSSNSISNFDPSGTLRWTVPLPNGEEVFGVAVDGLGSAYVSSCAGNAVYVRKFQGTSGNVLWSQTLDTGGFTRSSGIATDSSGNVYLSGYTHGTLLGPNAGNADGYVAKYSDTGVLQWVRQFGSAAIDYVWDVAADGLGNVYTVGQTDGSLGSTNAGESDAFITKHDATGNLQWIRQFASSGTETLNGVWADDAGNVFASGWTRAALGGAYLGGTGDALVMKYSTDGDLLWSKQLGTNASDAANDIEGDALGNLYIGGNTRGSWATANAGGADFVVAKLSAGGGSATSVESLSTLTFGTLQGADSNEPIGATSTAAKSSSTSDSSNELLLLARDGSTQDSNDAHDQVFATYQPSKGNSRAASSLSGLDELALAVALAQAI